MAETDFQISGIVTSSEPCKVEEGGKEKNLVADVGYDGHAVRILKREIPNLGDATVDYTKIEYQQVEISGKNVVKTDKNDDYEEVFFAAADDYKPIPGKGKFKAVFTHDPDASKNKYLDLLVQVVKLKTATDYSAFPEYDPATDNTKVQILAQTSLLFNVQELEADNRAIVRLAVPSNYSAAPTVSSGAPEAPTFYDVVSKLYKNNHDIQKIGQAAAKLGKKKTDELYLFIAGDIAVTNSVPQPRPTVVPQKDAIVKFDEDGDGQQDEVEVAMYEMQPGVLQYTQAVEQLKRAYATQVRRVVLAWQIAPNVEEELRELAGFTMRIPTASGAVLPLRIDNPGCATLPVNFDGSADPFEAVDACKAQTYVQFLFALLPNADADLDLEQAVNSVMGRPPLETQRELRNLVLDGDILSHYRTDETESDPGAWGPWTDDDDFSKRLRLVDEFLIWMAEFRLAKEQEDDWAVDGAKLKTTTSAAPVFSVSETTLVARWLSSNRLAYQDWVKLAPGAATNEANPANANALRDLRFGLEWRALTFDSRNTTTSDLGYLANHLSSSPALPSQVASDTSILPSEKTGIYRLRFFPDWQIQKEIAEQVKATYPATDLALRTKHIATWAIEDPVLDGDLAKAVPQLVAYIRQFVPYNPVSRYPRLHKLCLNQADVSEKLGTELGADDPNLLRSQSDDDLFTWLKELATREIDDGFEKPKAYSFWPVEVRGENAEESAKLFFDHIRRAYPSHGTALVALFNNNPKWKLPFFTGPSPDFPFVDPQSGIESLSQLISEIQKASCGEAEKGLCESDEYKNNFALVFRNIVILSDAWRCAEHDVGRDRDARTAKVQSLVGDLVTQNRMPSHDPFKTFALFSADFSEVSLQAIVNLRDPLVLASDIETAGLVDADSWIRVVGNVSLTSPIMVQAHEFATESIEAINLIEGTIRDDAPAPTAGGQNPLRRLRDLINITINRGAFPCDENPDPNPRPACLPVNHCEELIDCRPVPHRSKTSHGAYLYYLFNKVYCDSASSRVPVPGTNPPATDGDPAPENGTMPSLEADPNGPSSGGASAAAPNAPAGAAGAAQDIEAPARAEAKAESETPADTGPAQTAEADEQTDDTAEQRDEAADQTGEVEPDTLTQPLSLDGEADSEVDHQLPNSGQIDQSQREPQESEAATTPPTNGASSPSRVSSCCGATQPATGNATGGGANNGTTTRDDDSDGSCEIECMRGQRPDIPHLLISRGNTETLIHEIDIVNERLECLIQNECPLQPSTGSGSTPPATSKPNPDDASETESSSGV